MFSNEFKLFQ
uniref:Uncharacterized protein n=1 Tax=Anguilla anguilla TaxID=7936 RepID=A0A0E9TA48_ANGAN